MGIQWFFGSAPRLEMRTANTVADQEARKAEMRRKYAALSEWLETLPPDGDWSDDLGAIVGTARATRVMMARHDDALRQAVP